MKLAVFTTIAVALTFTTASAQKLSPELQEQVNRCMAIGYKKSCCIKSYGEMPAGSMNNRVRHQIIAKCSGVKPKG